MAARQIWLFLDDTDLAHVVSLLEAADPGVVSSTGRYLRGDSRALLDDPSTLERQNSLPGEQRLYLLHRRHSLDVVAHLQPAGPFAGWSQIDEERTDCLVLRTPGPQGLTLDPSQLYAHTSFWRGAAQTKKRHPFTKWANACLRLLLAKLPPSEVAFMRMGPSARKRARASELQLTYLLRPIAPMPKGGPLALPVVQTPAGTMTDDEGSDQED